MAVSTRERFPGEGFTHNTVVETYIASLSIRTELAHGSAGLTSPANATYLPVEAHRSSAGGLSSDEAGSQIPATTARGGISAKIAGNATRCSFLVEYASDQPPRRHCLTSKQEFQQFLINDRIGSRVQKNAEWLVQDGAFVVSLKTATSHPSECCIDVLVASLCLDHG